MDVKIHLERITAFLLKYKYIGIVFIAGILLMSIPTFQKEDNSSSLPVPDTTKAVDIHEQLADVLSYIQGAGNVKVMLKEKNGQRTVYQVDEDASSSDKSSSVKNSTVTLTDSNRNEYGLVCQINPPQYQGAIVVCQGADDPNVRLAVCDAVSKITGLGLDRIAVLKMK